MATQATAVVQALLAQAAARTWIDGQKAVLDIGLAMIADEAPKNGIFCNHLGEVLMRKKDVIASVADVEWMYRYMMSLVDGFKVTTRFEFQKGGAVEIAFYLCYILRLGLPPRLRQLRAAGISVPVVYVALSNDYIEFSDLKGMISAEPCITHCIRDAPKGDRKIHYLSDILAFRPATKPAQVEDALPPT